MLVELLDRLVLEIAVRIAVIGISNAVCQERDAAAQKHVHQHRRARSRQTRHDDDGSAVAKPPRDALGDDHRCRLCTIGLIFSLTIVALLAVPAPAHAYIGPGAGFAFLSSFLVLFTTIVVAVTSVLVWPLRALWHLVRRRKLPRALVRRLVVVGFDGQDPRLTGEFMEQGHLPNFARLAATGCYRRLRTTFPAVSPVAWSSFSTGTNPAHHNIFDFLDRDRRTYLPLLSSARVGKVDRFFRIGRYLIPRQRAELRNLRKSTPFWTILGEHGIWSTILRVPVTFPPDRFHGAQLSAMSVPDLLGTQGTFQLFTTRPAVHPSKKAAFEYTSRSVAIGLTPPSRGPRTRLSSGIRRCGSR